MVKRDRITVLIDLIRQLAEQTRNEYTFLLPRSIEKLLEELNEMENN